VANNTQGDTRPSHGVFAGSVATDSRSLRNGKTQILASIRLPAMSLVAEPVIARTLSVDSSDDGRGSSDARVGHTSLR
jgi:hypothetical protein